MAGEPAPPPLHARRAGPRVWRQKPRSLFILREGVRKPWGLPCPPVPPLPAPRRPRGTPPPERFLPTSRRCDLGRNPPGQLKINKQELREAAGQGSRPDAGPCPRPVAIASPQASGALTPPRCRQGPVRAAPLSPFRAGTGTGTAPAAPPFRCQRRHLAAARRSGGAPGAPAHCPAAAPTALSPPSGRGAAARDGTRRDGTGAQRSPRRCAAAGAGTIPIPPPLGAVPPCS